jgi:chromosome segregation ATPase
MPIDGPDDPESRRVPVIWHGQECSIDRDSLKYSLETAQAKANGARGAHYNPEEPRSIPFLQGVVDELQWFMSSAEEVIQACRKQIEQLKTRRAALHGKESSARYDEAISRLEMEMDRHVRVRSRLYESIRQVHGMIAECREVQRQPRIRAKATDY